MIEPTILFGIPIHPLTMAEAVGHVLDWAADPEPHPCRYVVTPNVDHAVRYDQDPELREAYSGAAMVVADGAPIVLASRLLGRPLPERVAGSDLVPAVLDRASTPSSWPGPRPMRVFLLGAGAGVGDRARTYIGTAWPNVEVVGTHSPPMEFEHDEVENQKIISLLNQAQPDVVLLGLGAPKQELWIHRHCDEVQAKVVLCIGATIDFLAGERKRAPHWMQRSGLEWLHRLGSEPGRLVGRYLHDARVFPGLVRRDWRQNHPKG